MIWKNDWVNQQNTILSYKYLNMLYEKLNFNQLLVMVLLQGVHEFFKFALFTKVAILFFVI